jgi:GNAT superfamily N-acetyltransferase
VVDDVLDRYARWLPERIDDVTSVLLVGEDHGGRIAGYLVGTVEPEVPIFWIPKCGWIHDIFVLPAARRLGLGDLLMQQAIEHFRGLGIQQMRLHTGAFNEAGRAFFARHGFRPSVTEMLRPLQGTPGV